MSWKRILVVDDTAASLKLARVVLESAGYEVRGARDSVEVERALGEAPFDLILMDLRLPGVDGFEVTRRLRRDPRTKDVPIVALSAYAMQEDQARARAAGCDGFLTKPIDTRTLAAAVGRHIAEGRPKTTE
jgi:CheY-like chemotaxis protein